MKRIILDLTVSLDGYIEGKNREVDWIIFDDEIGKELVDFADEIDTVFYGRVSYELYGNYSPSDTSGVYERDFYSKINKLKKYVFSTTIQSVNGNAVLINDNLVQRIEEVKSKPGKDIWLFGGSTLITTLLNLNLIDEIRIGINPVILGEGNPLFKQILRRKKLILLKTKEYQAGVVGLYYEVIKQ